MGRRSSSAALHVDAVLFGMEPVMTAAVTAFVEMTAVTGRRDELVAALEVVGEAIRRLEPGNLAFEVLLDPARPDAVFLYEKYRDEAAIAEHQAAAHVHALAEPVRALRTSMTMRFLHPATPMVGDLPQ